MMKNYKNKQLQIDVDGVLGHKAGIVINIKTDKKGIPLNADVRRHLRDAKFDNGCQIMKAGKKKTTTDKGEK